MSRILSNKTTFIVGNKKNSGKTTFLNSVLPGLRKKGKVAYLSIGVDGETRDQIFGFDKPRVFAVAGDYLVTAEEALKVTKATFRILKTFPYRTVLGRPRLVQVTGDGPVELIGPENNIQLSKILAYIHKTGIRTVLVDGAINRITQVASFKDAQFVFICRVDARTVDSAADELKRIVELSRIKCATGTGHYRIDGALTRSKAQNIDASVKKVVVDDFTKVFLTYTELRRFQASHKLYFRTGFKLALCVINLFGVPDRDFFRALNNKKIELTAVINRIGP